MPPLQQYIPPEQAPQDSVFSAAMMQPIETAFVRLSSFHDTSSSSKT